MRVAVALVVCVLAAPTSAQIDGPPPVPIPVLPSRAAAPEGFVPAGWGLDATERGDLNGDHSADLALVLRARDPAAVLPNEGGFCGETLDTNPRILAVALAQGAGYRLVAQNGELIARRDNPCAVDHFSAEESLEIRRGALRLSLERFMSAGGWSMGRTNFIFGWRQGALRLIGYEYSNVRRNTGETSTLSVNYPTERVKTATGNIAEDRERVRWSRLRKPALLGIEEIGDGLMFDPEELVSNLP